MSTGNRMTKTQAIASFRETVLPFVIERYGENDETAIRTAWCEYTDMLCQDGLITSHQDATWTNPF